MEPKDAMEALLSSCSTPPDLKCGFTSGKPLDQDRATKFPIRPDVRGNWHKSVAAVYYPYPIPEHTVERWLQVGK